MAGAVTALALGATLAGCASSSSGGSNANAPALLTKAQLDTQADAICTSEMTAGEAVPTPTNIRDHVQAAAWLDKIEPIIAGATTRLAALKPASDVATDCATFMTARQAFSAKMHEIRGKADAADPSGLTELEQLSTSDLSAAANAVGATACAEG